MAGFDEDFPGTSEAPELLTGARESSPNVIADKPGQQIAPTTLGGGGGNAFQSLANLAASFIGGGISRQAPQASANIQQTVARNLEQARKQRAGDQLNAASTLLGQAYESGDHKVISAAHKSLGEMLKGAEPEVQQHFADMAIKAGQQLGQQAKMGQLAEQYKDDPVMSKAIQMNAQGVPPAIVDAWIRNQRAQKEVAFKSQLTDAVLQNKLLPADKQDPRLNDPELHKMLGLESKAEPPAGPSTAFAAQAALDAVQQAKSAGQPVPKRIQDAFPGMSHDQIAKSLQTSIKADQQRQQQNIAFRIDTAETAREKIKPEQAAMWVDKYGNSLSPKDIVGKSASELPEGAVKLGGQTEINALRSARALPELGDRLIKNAQPVLSKYKGQRMGDIFDVQGNRLVIKSRAAAGDPQLAKFAADMTDFMIAAPQAQGIPGGRETVGLFNRLGTGLPSFQDTVESAAAKVNEQVLNVGSRWSSRGINITGGRKVTVGGKTYTRE